MDRSQTVLAVAVPWQEHSEVYELLRFLDVALASDGVPRRATTTTTWANPAVVEVTLLCDAGDALAAVRRAVQDAPVRVASVDVLVPRENLMYPNDDEVQDGER